MLIVLLALGITALDQWTKELVRLRFALGESVPLVPGLLHLTYIRNTGAAWGLFGGQNHWLILFSVLMLLVILFFRHSIHGGRAVHRMALGLMLGGIIGNLLDRIRFGYVVDFVDAQFRGRHFPAFNVADAAITVGVAVYLVSTFVEDRRLRRIPDPAALPEDRHGATPGRRR